MKGPGSKTVNIGDTVILRCDVAGDPQPTVTWTFPKVWFFYVITYYILSYDQ